uniref:Uncharacterized protein n=1 Tax=Strix occidentalis caurina TaxID=311401 RepID=A0A8D0KQ33_STROC
MKQGTAKETWPISPTVVVSAISVKAHFCVNASLDIYSLKITAPSMLLSLLSKTFSSLLHSWAWAL